MVLLFTQVPKNYILAQFSWPGAIMRIQYSVYKHDYGTSWKAKRYNMSSATNTPDNQWSSGSR